MRGPVRRSFLVAAVTAAAMTAIVGVLAGGSPVGATAARSATRTAAPAAGLRVGAAAGPALITRAGPGYWLIGGDGGVFPFGRGAYEGGLATRPTNAPIVGGAVTPTGVGYWLVASDGGVFAFGDARWSGSLPAAGASDVIVGMAATPKGDGYWLVGADGAVFAFGAARYLGGLSGRPLSAPAVAIAATADGRGYWIAGADGAMYAFGDAPYVGGLTHTALNAPITAMAPTATGRGYWLAGADGGVYAFGDAVFAGGLSGRAHARVVGIARSPAGAGYWLVAADGGVFGLGGAGYFGSVGASRLNRGVVGILSGKGIAIPTAPAAPASSAGFDVSWPQCDRLRPAPPYGFALVGITRGHMFSSNPCLDAQWAWATSYGSFGAVYVNTNAPTAVEFAESAVRNALTCGPDTGCVLDLWGRAGAEEALRAAGGLSAPMWWLDVETANTWLPDPAANAVIIRAMVDQLQRAGKRVGIYSTAYQWGIIAGAYDPGLPLWIPGAPVAGPAAFCTGHAFGGGRAYMVQSGDGVFDTDVLCGAGLAAYRTGFAPPAAPVVPQYPAPQPAPGVVATAQPTSAATVPPATPAPRPAPSAALAPMTQGSPLRPAREPMWPAIPALLGLALVASSCVTARRRGRHGP